MELKNRLSNSESPYLREAAHQPVHWQIFSDEAFKLATELDRPILLDIGAVWCHWCHVMDNESYSDREIAAIINTRFVPVKVDRDQMPDVDARYQSAISAMTGAGGWPLTGFLTPDGKAFYGGTYFPKNDAEGRPGLLSLLPQIAAIYTERRADVLKSADEVIGYVREFEQKTARPGHLDEKIADEIVKSLVDKFDKEFGGFGSAPKFFNATALQLLVEEASRTRGEDVRRVVQVTLHRMAEGGVLDQVGGGFHRYSVDRYWHVPHFEKMLYDNALLLSTYAKSYELGGNPLHEKTARSIAGWMLGVMTSPEGPFYAHQDADTGVGDDGSYWTWTESEVRGVLNDDEFAIMSSYFDIRTLPNDTRELPDRNVLRVAVGPSEIAKERGKSSAEIEKVIEVAGKKLLSARELRKPPFVDKTIIADRNGLAVSALIEASLALKERRYMEAASHAADFFLERLADGKGKIAHAYSGNNMIYQGLLDDQVYIGIALIDLFDVMRSDEYLDAAEKLAKTLLDEFEDKESYGFFDRPGGSSGDGLLSTTRKPIDDTPMPSGNSGAAIFFDRLFSITENVEYFRVSERTLKAFAGAAESLGIYVSNFARALRLHLKIGKNVR